MTAEPASPVQQAEAAAKQAREAASAAEAAIRRQSGPTREQVDDRRNRRVMVVTVMGIVATLVAVLGIAVLLVGQARNYQQEFTKRQTACVTSGGTWTENVGGDWECRR